MNERVVTHEDTVSVSPRCGCALMCLDCEVLQAGDGEESQKQACRG